MNTASEQEAEQFFNDFDNSDPVIQPPEQSNEMEKVVQVPFDQPIFSEDIIDVDPKQALLGSSAIRKNSNADINRLPARVSYDPAPFGFGSQDQQPVVSGAETQLALKSEMARNTLQAPMATLDIAPCANERSPEPSIHNLDGDGQRGNMKGITQMTPGYLGDIKSTQRSRSPTKTDHIKGLIEKMELQLDTPTIYTNEMAHASAAANKQKYMENFGINFEIPSVYVQDSKIYPQDPRYNLQLVRFGIPRNSSYQVVSHYIDGSTDNLSFAEHYKEQQQGLVLRLLMRDNAQLKKIDEFCLELQHALIKFSYDGTLFAFYSRDEMKFKVCRVDNVDIESFIDKIRHLELDESKYFSICQLNVGHEFIESIEFDQNKRFLIGYGGGNIYLYNLKEKHGQIHKINTRLYSRILHLNFLSTSSTKYCCYVACLRSDIRQVQVYDLMEDLSLRKRFEKTNHGEELSTLSSLNFVQEVQDDLQVMISNNFREIIFSNGQEKWILERKDGYYTQRLLRQLKNKEIRHITIDDSGGFYVLACQDYDKYLSVEHSNREEFAVRFDRKNEPGIMKIFDFHIRNAPGKEDNPMTSFKEIRIISMKDDEFLFTRADYEDVEEINEDGRSVMVQKNIKYFEFIFTPIRAFSINWPYVAFSGLGNFIIIINAFDRKCVRRVQIARPEDDITICQTYLTDTYDLFVVINKDRKFILYMIDLDAANVKEFLGENYDFSKQFQLTKLFEYDEQEVDGQQLEQIHIRGSSRKERIDLNKKLMAFFRHGKKLYSWVQLESSPNATARVSKLMHMGTCSSNLFTVSDNQFLYLKLVRTEQKHVQAQEIKMIQANFSTYDSKTVFKEQSQNETLKTFNVDQQQDNLIILSKKNSASGAIQKAQMIFKIFSLRSAEITYEQPITNKTLIGRLKSGLYTFVDGHIYYNNDVIKLRYDLMHSADTQMYKEEQIFDFYQGIFQIEANEKVQTNTPLDSVRAHRFGYIITDKDGIQPKKLLILPYLHERRIYLNRMKQNTEYFYTSIETENKRVEEHNNALAVPVPKPQLGAGARRMSKLRVKLDGVGMTPDAPSKPSKRKHLQKVQTTASIMSMFKAKPKVEQPPKVDSFTSIICMNKTRSKYYVYQQNGVLLNRIDFRDQVNKFGHPIVSSNNGQNFIFKKTKDQLEDLEELGLTDEELKRELMTLNVMTMTIFGMHHMKTINILDSINSFLDFYEPSSKDDDYYFNFHDQNKWLMDSDYQELREKIVVQCVINDNCDICLQIRHTDDLVSDFVVDPKQAQEAKTSHNVIYYYEAKIVGSANNTGYNQTTQDIYVTKDHKFTQFIINKKYIFMWDLKTIRSLELSKKFSDSNLQVIDFQIDPEDEQCFIKELRTGSQPSMIVIIVQQSKDLDSVISWDLKSNTEMECNDIEEEYVIIWDRVGKPYIVTKDKVIFQLQKCSLRTFDYEIDFEMLKDLKGLTFHKGHRLDSKNHNWLIFKEYLSLPFSYMSFVIKEKIEAKDEAMEGNVFDVEPYNYLFNKSTAFIDGEFVVTSPNELISVLQKLEEIEPQFLELLHYTTKIGFGSHKRDVTALQKALRFGNNRSVDIILSFMAKIPVNASSNFKNIMGELIEYKSFIPYLEQLPTQTKQMKKKQVLKVRQSFNDQIVQFTHSSCMYIDDLFWKKNIGERQDHQNFSVNVVSLQIEWIMNHPSGKRFLSEILSGGNLDFFKIQSLQMIIEYLFRKLKFIIIILLLPLYLLSHYFLEQQIHANMEYNKDVWQHSRQEGKSAVHFTETESKGELNTMILYNAIAVCIQIAQIMVFIANMKFDYFMRVYSLLDLLYVIMNLVIFYSMFSRRIDFMDEEEFVQSVQRERLYEVVAIMTLYAKASYFLSLVDQIAPLIDIIVKIVYDIRAFMFIVGLYVYGLSKCFNILGQSQVDFDGFDDQFNESIPYNGETNAIWYVGMMVIGSTNITTYQGSQRHYLEALFVLSVMIFLIHFLNMIIAIMGNTFAERTEVASQILVRDHLRFVMDNWYLMNFAFNDKKKVQHIVTAFVQADENEESELLHSLKESIEDLNYQVKDNFNKNVSSMREVNQMVADLIKRTRAKEQKEQGAAP